MSSTTNNTVYTTGSLINMLPSEPSICVPRIYMNITKERVHDVFTDLFGRQAIDRVDMIERENKAGEPYKRAFVHFKSWPRTEQSTEVRLKLLNGEEVKVVYDQPWYWRISASRLPRPEEQVRRKESAVPSRPFIMINEDAPRRPQNFDRCEQYRRDDQPREQYRRDDQPREQYRRNEQPREQYRRNEQPREQYRRDDQPREQYRRIEQPRREQRQPICRTPATKEPEIASWVVEKAAPGAPIKKGKKPRLVLEEETTSDDNAIRSRRRLSFDAAEQIAGAEQKTTDSSETGDKL